MTFSNPIVAGDTLVREAIQSENYQTGVQGWRIEADGDAELSGVTLRGNLTSGGFKNGDPMVAIDASGLGAWYGVGVRDDSTNFAAMKILGRFEYDAGDDWISVSALGSPSVMMILRGDKGTNGGNLAGLFVGSYGTIVNNAGWQSHASKSGSSIVEDWWQDMPLWNGWTHQGGHYWPQAKLLPHGSVELSGGIVGGNAADGTVVAWLPDERYWPTMDVRVPVASSVSNGNGSPRMVIRGRNATVNDPGDIEIFGVGSGAGLSFDGITFSIDK